MLIIENEDFMTLRASLVYFAPHTVITRKVNALIDITFHNIFSRTTQPSLLLENCYEETCDVGQWIVALLAHWIDESAARAKRAATGSE